MKHTLSELDQKIEQYLLLESTLLAHLRQSREQIQQMLSEAETLSNELAETSTVALPMPEHDGQSDAAFLACAICPLMPFHCITCELAK